MAAVKKSCIDCGVTGGEEKFFKSTHKSGRSYLSSRCKECHRKNNNAHYARRTTKGGNEPSTRTCPGCGVTGGLGVFSRNSYASSGLSHKCRACQANEYAERGKARPRDAIQACEECGAVGGEEMFHKTNNRASGLTKRCKACVSRCGRRAKYGVEINLNDAVACDICGKHLEWHTDVRHRLACVDHCHVTGVVRGTLCSNCNKGIGNFQDSPDLLWKAAVYLGGMRN